MRVSIDALASAKPRRLYRDAGAWVLEIERLVPIHDRILRPMLQRVSGDEIILFQLENSDEGKLLASSAGRLMRAATEGSKSYEVMDGQWVPSALAESGQILRPQYTPNMRADVATQDSSRDWLRTQGELLALRAAYERLVRRVSDLEKRVVVQEAELHRFGTAGATPAGVPVAQSVSAMPFAQSAIAPKAQSVAAVAGAEPTAASIAPAVAPAAASIAPAVEAAPVAPPAEAEPAPLKMPALEEFVERLKALVGDKIDASVCGQPLALSGSGLYASALVDDADGEVGVMVADLTAVVSLGANLMLLPQAEIDEQLRSKEPTEEVTSAMSEVFNTLSGAFNLVPGNAHVRTKALAPFAAADFDWLAASARRLDIVDNSGGRLTFVSRH